MTRHQSFNPNQLLTFLEVVTRGSESGAAAALGIGQPAISQQLRSLETALGCALFRRQGRRMDLTPSGDIAKRYASQLAALCRGLVDDLKEEDELKGHTVRLGILDGIPKTLVVRLSARLLSRSPERRLQLSEGKGQYLMTELAHHQLDAIVLNYSPESQSLKNLRAKKIGSLEVGAFASVSAAPSLQGSLETIMKTTPLILPTYHSRLRGECDRYFIENDIQPQTRVEVEDTALQKLLASQGFGLALLPILVASETQLGSAESPSSNDSQSLQLLGTLRGVSEDIWLVTHAPGKGSRSDEDLWQAAAEILGPR